MVARQFPWLLREEEGGARCRFVVAALLQFLCGDGGGSRVAGAVVKMEAARMEGDGDAVTVLMVRRGGRKR